MERNRKDFYVKLVDAKVITQTKYPNWSSYYFTNENKTLELWNNFKKNGVVTQDERTFFKNYACDLQPNSQYCKTQQTPTPNPTPNPNPSLSNDFLPCVIKKGKVRKTPSGADVIVYRTTVWDKPFVQLFANPTRFMVLGGKHKGKMGNYKCLQNNKLFLELDSVKKVDPKKEPPKLVSTNLTLDDILNGKGSVKIGMKGPVVGEIQKLLIAAGYKNISKSGEVDNIFGSRTKSMVVDFQKANTLNDDGIVGKNTLPKLKDASTKKSEYLGMGDDSPEFLQAQLDAQKSQLPANHGKREVDDGGNTVVWDGYNKNWLSDADYLALYNYDGTKKLQENIIKNIVIKNLHSLL